MKSFVINCPGYVDDNQDYVDAITVNGSFKTNSDQLHNPEKTVLFISVEGIKFDPETGEFLPFEWDEDGYELRTDIVSAEDSPTGTPAVKIYPGGIA